MTATGPTAPVRDTPPSRLVVSWSAVGTDRAHADHLLRLVVGRFCDVAPADVQARRLCPGCGSTAHGRPLVAVVGCAAPHVSLSRAGGLVCVAVTDAGPVGVDVERSGAAAFGDFATVGLHRLERSAGPQDQTVTWVRKESLVKATGAGLRVDLRQVRLSEPAATPPALLAWEAPSPPSALVWMRDVVGPRGYVLAVSVLTSLEPQLTAVAAEGGGPAQPIAQAAPAAPRPPATR